MNESSGDDLDANGDDDGPNDQDNAPLSQVVLTCSQVKLNLPSWDSHCCDDFLIYQFDFKFFTTADTEYVAFQNGALDVGFIPSSRYQVAVNQPYFHQAPFLGIDYVQPNWSRAPFDDLRARQAFALALNKDLIANAVFKGAVIPTNHFVPQGQCGYDANLTGVSGASTEGDPAQAKSLITAYAADKCGGDVKACTPVTFETDNSTTSVNESQAFLQMWQTAMPGYPVSIRNVKFNTLLTDVYSQPSAQTIPQLVALGYTVDYPDPSDWLSLQFGTSYEPNSSSLVGITDPKAQQLMQQADITQDVSQRSSLENQAEQELVNNVAWIPIDQEKDLLAVRSSVHNYADSPLGYPSLVDLYATYLS